MSNEPLAIEDHFHQLLDTIAELVTGTVAVAFVASEDRGTWTAPRSHEALAGLAGTVRQQLDDRAEGGLVDGVLPDRAVWVEPAFSGAEDGERAAQAGALGIARLVPVGAPAPFSQGEIDAIRVVAKLCGSATGVADMTRELEYQRQIEELVSQVAERLMATTNETMSASLDWTVETLALYLKADSAFLRRNDHANGVSILMAEYPERDAPDPDPLAVVAFDVDPIFAATRDLKGPLVMRNPEAMDTDYTKRVEDAGVAVAFSGAGVPLIYGDVTEGCLAFVRFSALDWADHEISALRMVASLLVHLTHRLEMDADWRRRAMTDELTGLPNRRALLAEIDRRRLARNGPLQLLFVDLDRFKVMNDYLGHGVGDKLLTTIADRIRDSARPGDFAARLGGDEFVVLLAHEEPEAEIVRIAEELLEVISQPVLIEGMEIVHSGSIGIAGSTDEDYTAEALLGQADIALYAAKRRGRNQLVVFDAVLQKQVAERSDTELMLRQAFADQQNFSDHETLVVFYQPEFDIAERKLAAVEALVRWNHPTRGLLTAGEFIPVAEETHLMPELGNWVLRQACAQMARWRAKYPGLQVVLRVNMSPGELVVPGVVSRVRECLVETGLPPGMLCLEITENMAVINVEQTVQVLREFRALGVQLAMDDFGSGYSSMIQLKNLPVDVLKIDRVFVDGIATDPTNQGIVEAIIRLGAAFALEVVAEGVETPEDLEELFRLGCRRIQGFLLSRPVSAQQVEPFLAGTTIDLDELIRRGRRPEVSGPADLADEITPATTG
jgi:diguanylate cyclase (GGDEF)-like protein